MPHKQDKKLRHAFQKTLRKMALTASFGLFATTTSFSQTTQPRENDSLNKEILKEARQDFGRIATYSENSYSKKLDSLQNVFQKRFALTKDSLYHDTLYVLDPAHFDTGMALGIDRDSILSEMLKLKSTTIYNARSYDGINHALGLVYTSPYGTSSYYQGPMQESDGNKAFLIPPTDHALHEAIRLEGFSYDDATLLITLHEAYHAIDNENAIERSRHTKEQVNKSKNAFEHIRNKHYIRYVSAGCLTESLADIGAVGDMIRAGYGMALLDAQIKYRKSDIADWKHHTAPALEGFKKAIEMRGLEKFRAMNDEEALRFYYAVNNTYGITPSVLYNILKIQTTSRSGEKALEKQGETNLTIRTAFQYIDQRYDPKNQRKPMPKDKEYLPIPDEMKNWDPLTLLKEKAFEIGKKITPETVAKAYGILQTDLRTEMIKNPDDPLWREKMLQLKQTYSYHLKRIDFVAENTKRGVNPKTLLPPKKGP